jgi:hypothetical protein
MSKKLKKFYFILLVPLILGFEVLDWTSAHKFIELIPPKFSETAGSLLFILCGAFSIAFPISYRSLFAYKSESNSGLSQKEFLKFERTLIGFTMVATFIALLEYIYELPRFYTAGAIFFSLCALFFLFPSHRRIASDQKIYKVKKWDQVAENVTSVVDNTVEFFDD